MLPHPTFHPPIYHPIPVFHPKMYITPDMSRLWYVTLTWYYIPSLCNSSHYITLLVYYLILHFSSMSIPKYLTLPVGQPTQIFCPTLFKHTSICHLPVCNYNPECHSSSISNPPYHTNQFVSLLYITCLYIIPQYITHPDCQPPSMSPA